MLLVTGGAGFIGTNLILELNRRGITDIVICDTMIDSRANRCANLQRLQYQQLINPWGLHEWLGDRRELDAVIHLGAITDTTRTDAEVFTTNYASSIELFLWCTAQRVPFIYASSAAVYGSGLHGFNEDSHTHYLRPLSHYGWSKNAFDLWVLRHGARRSDHPPGCVGLRFFNVYGPHEVHKKKMASMVSQMIDTISSGMPVKLFRSPRPNIVIERDFVHVDDVVSVILWFMERDDFGIFNVGTGQTHTFENVALVTSNILAKTCEIEHIDMPVSLANQYQYCTRANMAKLRKAGYPNGFIPLHEGVRRTIEHRIMPARALTQNEVEIVHKAWDRAGGEVEVPCTPAS